MERVAGTNGSPGLAKGIEKARTSGSTVRHAYTGVGPALGLPPSFARMTRDFNQVIGGVGRACTSSIRRVDSSSLSS